MITFPQHRIRSPMFKRSLASAVLAAVIAGAAALPAGAQTPSLLSLNAVQAAPADGRGTWRLTLEFGRADRSASATTRSVRAPELDPHEIVISTPDGIAAPFIIREVGAPVGNAVTVLIEHFGPEPPASSDRFVVSVLHEDRVAEDRASAEFDFLPPALQASDG